MPSVHDTYWLIKSGGRIIGPLNYDAVAKALRSKEVVPLDEISSSFGRWHYIRDEKTFEPVMTELRNRKGGSEHTVTDTGETATDITERVYAFGPSERLTSNISDQLNEKRSHESSSSGSDSVVTNVYGYSKDKEFSGSQKPKANIFIWISLVLVVGGISLKVISSKNFGGGGAGALEKAKNEFKVGNYQESIKFFKESYKGSSSDPSITLDYAGSLLGLHQSAEARKLLNELVSSNASTQEKSRAFTGLAVASIQDNDYINAAKNTQEAIKLNPSNGLAYANQGVVYLFESKYSEAEKSLLDALDRGVNDPAVAIQLAEASFLNSKNGGGPEGALRAKIILDTSVKNAQVYQQESLAYRLHVSVETKEASSLDAIAIQLLNTDPQLTQDHVRDPYLSRDRAEWDHIAKYLKSSIGEDAKNPHLLAALGFAMFMGREKLEGKKIIEDAQTKAPDDKLIRSVLSYAQFQMGREDEAVAGLTIALDSNQYSLPILLKARSCRDKKDFLCSEENWKKLLNQDDRSIVAIAGLAWTELDKGRTSEARGYISKALLLDPSYIPAIKADMFLKGNR